MKRALSARVPDFQQKLSPALNNDPWMKSGRKNQIVTEEDIFLRLSELKWRKATNLTISNMTSDIFNVTKEELLEGEEKYEQDKK